MVSGQLRYRRILLKLSGEALQGSAPFGIDPSTLDTIARQVAAVIARGVEVGMVIGGGNIWRGEPAAEPRAWTAPRPTTWACWPRS